MPRSKRTTMSADAAVSPSIRRRRGYEKRIVGLFKAIDQDGDGFLEKREVSRGLRNAQALRLINEEAALQPLLDPVHWEKTFSEMDGTDSTDGRVTFTEFRSYCMSIVGANDDGIAHDADVPTNDQAIVLLQVPSADRTEEHIDALLLWSKINPATKKLFEPLPVDLLREVVRALSYMCCEPGDFVCEQGDIGSLFYVILKGTIDFYVRSEKEQAMEMNIRTAGGLGTAKPTSHELIVQQRIGKLVASMSVGKGFGELALLAPAGSAKRSASCMCPTSLQEDGSPAIPCHLLTLERQVYYRLAKVTASVGTDIGAKVRTIQDSVAFSWWPRSHVVRFAINLTIMKIRKNGFLCRAGQKADKMFLISSGEVGESQPITLQEGLTGNTIVYPWSSNTMNAKEQRCLNKIEVDLGRYGPLDYCGALSTLLDYPFYFTTLKALTNVTVVVIHRTYFNMFLRPAVQFGVDREELPESYGKTLKLLTRNVKLREVMRKQRVRAALASPNITVQMTSEMVRHFVMCGRCGRRGHSWGEENDYGMMKCPMASGAGGRSQRRHNSAFFGKKGFSRKAQNHSDKSIRNRNMNLLGSQRWSLRQSQRMRGGTPCTVGSLSSLLSTFEEEDKRDSYQRPSRWSRLKQRPSTSMGQSNNSSSSTHTPTRPQTSMSGAAVSRFGNTAPQRRHGISPLSKKRSQKVLDMLQLHAESPDEFGYALRENYLRESKNHFVMAHDLTNEAEGREYERELKKKNMHLDYHHPEKYD